MCDIPMIVGRKPLEPILPNSSQLRDPMKSFASAVKENVAPSTAAKKQTTLEKHVRHSFTDPIPKIKKSTAILGNYRASVPSRLRHRICPCCLRIFKNKLSQNGVDTPHAHMQTSQCPFIKANMTNQIGTSHRCHICFEVFTQNKSVNNTIIQHFADFDHPINCPFSPGP